jgi:uncharacterized protein (DUF983 family)
VPEVRPPVAVVLRRALCDRCPACGVGRVFGGTWRSAGSCVTCGWLFERGEGHWVGGNEVNLLVTFPVSVAVLALPAVALGPSFWTAAAGGALALALGIAAHRPARCLFFAVDYLVDPAADPPGPGPDDLRGPPTLDGPPPHGPAPHPPARRVLVELPVPTPAPRPDAEPLPAPAPSPA